MISAKPQTRIDNLRARIIAAFSSVPRPSKENIARHQCEKCEELRNVFGRLRWEAIEPEILEKYYSKLSLFTPQAFRYFLPAYLLQSLEGFNDENIVCQFTIYSLAPIGEEDDAARKWWLERIEEFTQEQKDVIAAFLRLAVINRKLRVYREQAESGLKKNWSCVESKYEG